MLRATILAATFLSFSAYAAGQDAATGSDETQIEGIVAVVNDDPISISDVRQRARLLASGTDLTLTPELSEQITQQAVDQLIQERLKLQEAAQFDLVIERSAIDREIARIAQQAGITPQILYEELTAAGVNPESLEDQLRADIAWRRIMGGRFGSRIRISQNQIDDQIEQMTDSASKEQFRLSEIFLYAPNTESKSQAGEAARQIRQQLDQNPQAFGIAAQQYSFSSTAAANGDMGWMTLEDLEEPVADAVLAATGPGLIGPVFVDDGVYLLALRARRQPEADAPPFVNLRQLIATDRSADTLQRGLSRVESCNDLEDVAERVDNLRTVSIGNVISDELSPEMRQLAETIEVGTASEPFETRAGLTALYICDRRIRNKAIPTRVQIEDRLYNQELNMISDREIRNLERNAMIIRR